jgi:hypothetical protein
MKKPTLEEILEIASFEYDEDGKLVLTRLDTHLIGDHHGDHIGTHIGDHEGSHKGDHIGYHEGTHIGIHEGDHHGEHWGDHVGYNVVRHECKTHNPKTK